MEMARWICGFKGGRALTRLMLNALFARRKEWEKVHFTI